MPKSLAVNQPKTPRTASKKHANGADDAATRARREATAERAREAHLRSERRGRGAGDGERAALLRRVAAAEAEAAALRAERDARGGGAAAAASAAPRLLASLLDDARAAGAADPQAAAAEVFVTLLEPDWRASLRRALEGPARPERAPWEPAAPDDRWDARRPRSSGDASVSPTMDRQVTGVTGIYVDDEWVQFMDDDTRCYFYYSTLTGRTKWQRPGNAVASPLERRGGGSALARGAPAPPRPWSPPGSAAGRPPAPAAAGDGHMRATRGVVQCGARDTSSFAPDSFL